MESSSTKKQMLPTMKNNRGANAPTHLLHQFRQMRKSDSISQYRQQHHQDININYLGYVSCKENFATFLLCAFTFRIPLQVTGQIRYMSVWHG